MNTITNSYFFGRLVIWFRAGSFPCVTIASSTLRLEELACRTSPTEYDCVTRHYSNVVNVETFRVDRNMLDQIRSAMSSLFTAAYADSDGSIKQSTAGSNWSFHPREDGWFAMYDGKIKDIRSFRYWLSEKLT